MVGKRPTFVRVVPHGSRYVLVKLIPTVRALAGPMLFLFVSVAVAVGIDFRFNHTINRLSELLNEQAACARYTMQQFITTATDPDGFEVTVTTTCGEGETQAECYRRHRAAVKLVETGGEG